MKYTYKLHQNIYQDAWNWWDACSSANFGTDWSLRVKPQIAQKIKGKNKQEAYQFLIPYLREEYQESKLHQGKLYIQNELRRNFSQACEKIVNIMGKPLYRQDFHFYLTTFPSIPYNKKKGYIWLNYNWDNPTGTFLHELCHLQFIHYWREDPKSPVSRLPEDRFEDLKESLTMIIDQDFFPLIKRIDRGYPKHQDFRKKLSAFWQKEKNFNKLVKFGIQNLPNFLTIDTGAGANN